MKAFVAWCLCFTAHMSRAGYCCSHLHGLARYGNNNAAAPRSLRVAFLRIIALRAGHQHASACAWPASISL